VNNVLDLKAIQSEFAIANALSQELTATMQNIVTDALPNWLSSTANQSADQTTVADGAPNTSQGQSDDQNAAANDASNNSDNLSADGRLLGNGDIHATVGGVTGGDHDFMRDPDQVNILPDGTKVSFTVDEYITTTDPTKGDGIAFQMAASVDSPVLKYVSYNFINRIVQNDSTLGPEHPVNISYIDKDLNKDGKNDFYYNPIDLAQNIGHANSVGASITFGDNPTRDYQGSVITWNAQTTLVGIKSDGLYDSLGTVSWGFWLDENGIHKNPVVIH